MNKKKVIEFYKLNNSQIKLFDRYLLEVKESNMSFNLVGKSTLDNFWDRHICDSLQITSFIKNKKSKILDMGTGAGIPGIILTIFGYTNVTLVDSKKKKTNFVKKFIHNNKLTGTVINSRVENMNTKNFDFIVARALAPLEKLLNYSLFFLNKNTTLVFLKGRNVNKEIIDAKKNFLFDFKTINSKSSGNGHVIKINKIKKL